MDGKSDKRNFMDKVPKNIFLRVIYNRKIYIKYVLKYCYQRINTLRLFIEK